MSLYDYIRTDRKVYDEYDKALNDYRGMLILAKTDEGMAELLEQAAMYYSLKKPAQTISYEEELVMRIIAAS